MAEFHYSSERNVQTIVSLLKSYGVKRIIASPGATNVTFVVSVQFDPFFEVYSCVDERSAAYMACGMADETGEPVVLSCTGATSSRNYLPALTEAYYRKLPILAITSSQESARMGHLFPQITDRTTPPSDTVLRSFLLPFVKDDVDSWECVINSNKALQLLTQGPVHINLETRQTMDYFVKELPRVRKIDFSCSQGLFPDINYEKIAVFVGSHRLMTQEEVDAIDSFCEAYNAVVLCDQTSGYHGKYKILSALILGQKNLKEGDSFKRFDLVIHIGEISGDYFSRFRAKEVWRVNEDGEIRDPFRSLSRVFKCSEQEFFSRYSADKPKRKTTLYDGFRAAYERLLQSMPELPFCNAFIAKRISGGLPKKSYVHLGILNSLRSWNLFETPPSVICRSNVGGFGIDGVLSTAIGGSIVKKENLHFCILGDLSFFYDMNSLGNHHIGGNLRVLVINNGRGVEFRTSGHVGDVLHDETDKYIAAAGHFGAKSEFLIKNYAGNLGFDYICAHNKEEFEQVSPVFLSTKSEKPILFEVFTDTVDENEGTRLIRLIDPPSISSQIKSTIVDAVGPDAILKIKRTIRR